MIPITEAKKTRTGKGWIIGCAAVPVALAAAALIWGGCLQAGSTIFPQVQIAGVPVGGMKAAEAEAVVEEVVGQRYAQHPLQVVLPDETVVLEPELAQISVDAAAAVEEAMAFGRDRGLFGALLTRLQAETAVDVPLENALTLNEAYVNDTLQQAADRLYVEPIETQTETDDTVGTLQVLVGRDGRSVDLPALTEAVLTAYRTGQLEPLHWDYTIKSVEPPEANRLEAAIRQEPADAYYDAELHTIVEDQPGLSFDIPAAEALLADTEPGQTCTIELQLVPAALTAEDLNSQMFGDKLESRAGPYSEWQQSRTNNVKLACDAINGTIVNPGETFSFNETVGERTEEKGYQYATIYVNSNEAAPGLGGGICQVASILYYTTLHLEVTQVERTCHALPVTYVPPGMDAAIYWDGKQDYKFRNDYSHPIKIEVSTENSEVRITIWGVKESDNYVEMTYEVYGTTVPVDVETLDQSKPAGYREQVQKGSNGYSATAYRTLYAADGTVIETTKEYSKYNKQDNKYIVGPPLEEQYPEWMDPSWGEEGPFEEEDPLA